MAMPELHSAEIGLDVKFDGADVAVIDTDLLRLVTCGSVDDGKSTLIGRLIYDLGQVPDDIVEKLRQDTRTHGTADDQLDYAQLVDGLSAEREQGITIDVAYRYIATEHRKFIIADTPGHEQYTRNMATGASVADAVVVLVDARKGIVTQTRRHSTIAHLLGLKHFVLAVNKMDLVDYDEAIFNTIRRDYLAFCEQLGITGVACIPVAARSGENLADRSGAMPWYHGPSLIEHLEAADIAGECKAGGFLFPVQRVNRPNADFRGYDGTVARGDIQIGDDVVVMPSARTSRVKDIISYDGNKTQATSGDAISIVLADEIDISRGDVVAARRDRPQLTDQFAAHVIWLNELPLLAGRVYLLKSAHTTVTASVTSLKHKLDVDTLSETAGRKLDLNDIGFCNISTGQPIVFTPYEENKTLGSFILIDKLTNQTVGAGLIRFGLRRADNLHWQPIDIDRQARGLQKGQKAFCLWFTGLSGAGKSAIANALDRKLFDQGRHAFILDGDNVRHGLNRDLGFTDADRVENIRRVAEVARLMVDAGLITIVSFISPFRAERRLARELFLDGDFFEVFIDAPLAVCEERDVKGLYKRARAGELKNFTGIDSAYEPPESAEFRLDSAALRANALAEDLMAELEERGLLTQS